MDFRSYRITKDDSGRRIDRVARRFLPEMPLSGIYRLLRKGLIRVDGNRISPDFPVSEGSELCIASVLSTEMQKKINRFPDISNSPQDSNASFLIPEILLETPDLLFLNKPAGIPVHGENGLDRIIPPSSASLESLSFKTGPLHRLDRDTTGILAFSRSLVGARWFSSALVSRQFKKYYLGITRGYMSGNGEWRDTSDGKEMITYATPLAFSSTANEPLTLVQYRILTGRKHQIRVQTSRHGYPLDGDSRYGGATSRSFTGYCLHAWQLSFPTDRPAGLPATIIAPLPPLFTACIVERFGPRVLARIDEGELYWSEHEEPQ